jgi:hypothetical protein
MFKGALINVAGVAYNIYTLIFIFMVEKSQFGI